MIKKQSKKRHKLTSSKGAPNMHGIGIIYINVFNMRTCKIDSDKRRIQFRDFVLVDKKLSTVRGYISALSAESLVGTLSQELFKTRDVFNITDGKQLMLLYSKLLKHPQNKNSHSRFTAALNYYMKFVNLK